MVKNCHGLTGGNLAGLVVGVTRLNLLQNFTPVDRLFTAFSAAPVFL